jgi:hypothetical protein
MVIPFALWSPIFMMIMISTIELGTMTIRHTALERALDLTVRDVRLGTGTEWKHDDLKDSICKYADILPRCQTTMNLEMIKLDMRAFNEPDYYPDCVDISADTQSQRTFQNGEANEVVFLRACYKYEPFTPVGYLGGAMMVDREGYTALIASSAFVLEPE